MRKLHGKRLDHDERARKKAAREGHKQSHDAQNLRGLKAKMHAESRRKEKIQMRKQIKAHEERDVKTTTTRSPASPCPRTCWTATSVLETPRLANEVLTDGLQPEHSKGYFLTDQEQAGGKGSQVLCASAESPRVSWRMTQAINSMTDNFASIAEEEMFKVIGTGKKTHQKS